MLLALVLCHLSVLVAANPFHKYPFVFLLDVGNEELEKTNSEQIRVSVPGGSVALRYPAVGNGDTISHVRVSGIDFGTDLKANIVDGGPGYKYVVLVFMGNPGVAYDAVVTLQTVTDDVFNTQNTNDGINSVNNAYQSEEDINNSAEDLSDTEVSNDAQSETYIQNSNAELTQSSSKVYSYVDSESMDENDDADNENSEESGVPLEDNGDSDDVRDSGEQPNEDIADQDVETSGQDGETSDQDGETSDQDEQTAYQESDSAIEDIHDQNEDNVEQNNDESVQVRGINNDDNEEASSNDEQYSPDDYSAQSAIVDNSLYSKYVALKDHFNFGGEVYSQEDFQKSSRPVYQEDPLDYEDVDAGAPVYEDEENNGVYKYRDSNNNNYVDSDDSYAVAY